MPELPEVETVRRGLAPAFSGARIERVTLNRPDLRYPLPERFVERLVGRRPMSLDRRGKYLVAPLDSGESLVMHLGMSGRFSVKSDAALEADANGRAVDPFYYATDGDKAHDHVVFDFSGGALGGSTLVTYNDPRRFGFMDLVATDAVDRCRHFEKMGPEPLSSGFNDAYFKAALRNKKTSIKAAILDQSVVAGVGNIYACEALYRARISPRRLASSVAGVRSDRLRAAIVDVLQDAIAAGGSTLRDFAAADGALGYFQHRFDVYDRAGEGCRCCDARIKKLVQSNRSTFYCGGCQR
ncbi:MAG: bifunctional DNA-formamidopyrimidine glycosylase/DNA-(apurinic or apyrimidinic site) lyase [Pseudomonadota bacterium]